MPLHEYDIIVTARITLGGKFNADTAAEAVEQATTLLRKDGVLDAIEVERQVLLDEEER